MPVEKKREPGQSGGFVPSTPLEELLAEAFRNPEKRPDFYRQMLDAEFVVLGSARNADGFLLDTVSAKGARLTLRQWKAGGRAVVPFFTAPERIREFSSDSGENFKITGRILLASQAPDVTLVLNPRSPYSKDFPPQEIAAILDGSIFDKLR
jgi:hypothetical protein